ncbi:MAG: hypothetical protein HKO62_07135 [Gammaproteobacteria bacterium]|nr:hypothetical protein [Gammaproteobacteria bacterium]
MTYSRNLLAIVALLLTASCATMPVPEEDWPGGIPGRSYFSRLYDDDPTNQAVQSRDEYLRWVTLFYQGTAIYPRGWKNISKDILAEVEARRFGVVGAKLTYLGQMIAGEWSKDSRQRAIFNKTVSVWGDAIYVAADRNEIEAFIDKVIADVLALLDRELAPDAIVLSRYYEDVSRPEIEFEFE